MDHSDQIREFRMTDKGVVLVDVYAGPAGALTGSARAAREAEEEAAAMRRKQELERKRRELERKRTLLQAQLATLQAQFEAEEEELQMAIDQELASEKALAKDRKHMAQIRKADAD